MKILKSLLVIIALLASLFFAVGLLLPSKWETSRSRQIDATPTAIYSAVVNLKRWQEWSPWKDEELKMISTYSGPDEGVGAQWNWTSETMGSGWLKIIEADSMRGIKYDLFIDMNGSKTTLQGEIAFETNGQGTKVTWTDRGDSGNKITRKWMAMLMGFMMKRQMSKGLEQLNTLVSSKTSAH